MGSCVEGESPLVPGSTTNTKCMAEKSRLFSQRVHRCYLPTDSEEKLHAGSFHLAMHLNSSKINLPTSSFHTAPWHRIWVSWENTQTSYDEKAWGSGVFWMG